MERIRKLKSINLKYMHDCPNAGDQFSFVLAKHFFSDNVISCSRKPLLAPNLILVGSYLRNVDSYSHVCGAGCISSDPSIFKLPAIPRAIHCLRGPLTAELLKKRYRVQCPEVYADPGILAPEVYPRKVSPESKVGIIPHFVDINLPWIDLWQKKGIRIIDPRSPLDKYFTEIQKSEIILSSSLHGIIFAHAYHKPALWIELSDKVIGDGFKFYDYYASLGTHSDKVRRVRIELDMSPYEISKLAEVEDQSKLVNPLKEAISSAIENLRKDQCQWKLKNILFPINVHNRKYIVKKANNCYKIFRNNIRIKDEQRMKDHTICFIIGCGRSGTHYLAKVIDTAENVFLTYETPDIFPYVVDYVTLPDKSLAPAIKKYKYYHKRYPVYVDKSHPNLFNVPVLLSHFPKAKFIGIYRNVFETVASMLKHEGCSDWVIQYKKLKFPNDFLGLNVDNSGRYETASLAGRCAFRWCSHYLKLMQLKQQFPDQLLVINYTDLIEQNQQQTQRVGEFLGVQLQPIPPDKTTRDKWKTDLTPEQQQEIREVLEYVGINLDNL